MRRLCLFCLLLLPLLVACGSRSPLSPTPFPTAGASPTLPNQASVALTVTELMAAPGLYRDATVQLTGLLRKQPLIVCDTDLHASPAGWALAEEGVLALAGGFDEQVRSLLPGDLLISAEGRWRLWQGLVGCGKQAQQRDVWYLEVSRILSPSPLTQVTLTPGSEIGITAIAQVSPTMDPALLDGGGLPPTPVLVETPEAPLPTQPVESYPITTEEPATEGGGGLPTLPAGQVTTTPTPSATLPAGLTGTPATTGTPTTTGTPATPTPTVTGTPPTTTPTATGGAPGQVVDQGNFYEEQAEDFIATTLEAGQIHSWTVDLFADEESHVYVIAPAPVDIVLSMIKDGQTLINRQNTAPAGSPEIINVPSSPSDGTYQIQVAVNGGGATEYAITAFSDSDTAIVINGTLASGSPHSAVQLPAEAMHYWFFMGTSGQNLTVELSPVDTLDPDADLYGPESEHIDSIAEGFEGEDEFFETTLEATGLHALGIYEASGEPMSYNVVITLE